MNNKILPFLVLSILIFLSINYLPKEMLAEEMNTTQDPEDIVVVIFDQEGRYIAHFKATVPLLPAEGFNELQFFFKNGKAYAVAEEDEYKFVKRYSFEIQEYRENKWVKKNISYPLS